MSTVRKTITVTDQQSNWIKSRIKDGDYTNDSEYMRDLIRRDQKNSADFQTLKQSIQDGLKSGISDKTVPQIMEEVEKKLRSDGQL